MAVEQENVERFLSVGAIVMFHTAPNWKTGPRYKSAIRGWRQNSCVFLDRPRTVAGGFAALQEGQQTVVRFVSGGIACAFDCVVIDWDTRCNNPHLRVSWPKEIQHVTFRKYERVKMDIACTLESDGERVQGEIRDLSLGGCGVSSPRSYPTGCAVELGFELPGGKGMQDVEVTVRSVRAAGDAFFLGCEFESGQEAVENDLALFVTTALGRASTSETEECAAERVLIMDDNADVCTRLKRGFEKRGLQVVIATNTLDGMHGLRMVNPVAVAVSHTLADLAGSEVCRLIKMHSEFKALPVFLYGGEPELAAHAQAIGVDGYVPARLSVAPDVVLAVVRALAKPSAVTAQ